MQLVDETRQEQVVPQYVAAEHQNLAAGSALQLGDGVVCIGAADDAGSVLPRPEIGIGQGVGDDDLVDRVVEARDLALDRWLLGVVGDPRPIVTESLERAAAEEQRIGRLEPLEGVA